VGYFEYNLRFPGQYYDYDTGFFYNYYRTLDPKTGRYLQADPIGLDGGSLSLYTYVDNQPIRYVDPDGLQVALPVPLLSSTARPIPGTLVDPLVAPITSPNDPKDDGESEKCKNLRKKLENLRTEVYDKRIPDLEANPGNLPQRIGPGEKLRDTVRGHEKLLNRQWRRLNELENEYFKECGC
jgi:RHS repeat-associated protein